MAWDHARVEGLLFDLNGVFYTGDEMIAGAGEALDAIRERGIPYRFITNTTTQSRDALVEKLGALGLDVEPDSLMTAPIATRDYLLRENLLRCHFVVDRDVLRDFRGLEAVDREPDAVVIGDIGDRWGYALLDRLFAMLTGGARLVAVHRNRYSQSGTGLHVDIGLFVAGLEYAADTEAVLTGKPSRRFFEAAARSMELEPSRVAVVGDDVDSDVGGAQGAGMQGVLVRTGKYRPELVDRSGVTPDAGIGSIADLARLLGDS